MSRPRLLDLFCGAGGCAMGYHRAGFDVVGVDVKPQPRYPFEFHQADALEYLAEHGHEFDAIHASPPCQAHSPLRNCWNAKAHPCFIEPARELLRATGLPFVIENVPGSPLTNAFMLCGTMFRLGCDGAELRRHRYFECHGFEPGLIRGCEHGWSASTIGVYGHRGNYSRAHRAKVIGVYGGHGRDRRRVTAPQDFPTSARREAMGIDWMNGLELSQAIPPAYTEFIGARLLEAMRVN